MSGLLRIIDNTIHGVREKLRPVELVDNLKNISQHNWEQSNETQDPDWGMWLYKHQEDRDRKRKIDPVRLNEKYCQLHDEYANATGGFFVLEKIMILMEKRMRCRAMLEKDPSQINFVNLYTEMIEQLTKVDEEVDVVKNRMIVQKAYGQPIDVHKTSAYEFAMITKALKEEAAQINAKKNGKNRSE